MLALLAALATVAGLVHLAATRSERRASREERRLASLRQTRDADLDLDQAEDGAVLARRFGLAKEENRFKRVAENLKRGGRRA